MNAKTLAAAILLGLLGGAARAHEDDASRQLRNLVYYPHAGQFRAVGEFTGSLQENASTDNSLGNQNSARSESYAKAEASLAYGVVDGLRLVVSETDLFDQKIQTTDKTSGLASNSDSHGFSDPTVTVLERYHDSPDDGFSGDVSGSFVPRLGRALAAGNGQSGNDLNDAWSATLAAPLYYRLHTDGHANEFEFEPSVTRSFGGVASGAALSSSTLSSSFWSAEIVLSNRYHVNDSWYVQPGLTLTLPFTLHTSAQTPGAADTLEKTAYVASPNVHIGYLPASWLLIDASVTYAGTGTTTYPNNAFVQNQQTYAELQVQAAF